MSSPRTGTRRCGYGRSGGRIARSGEGPPDERVSEFLEQVGQVNIVSIDTVSYSVIDMATHHQVDDYGVLVVFKG